MVMYRDFVQRHARSLRLVGMVRNLSDGSVEVLAQGSREKLEELVQRLHTGPLLSRVVSVDVEWRKPAESMTGFFINYE